MTKEERYSVWITDSDGTNGRWMSDRDNGVEIWSGSQWQAQEACHSRRMYRHVIYEVRPTPQEKD